ncbi:MAG: DUF721 domain-containing protein, partial [Micrococcales bacterium]|nr:DUF721 domain-containing protein [Micrococcales bacterium]
MSVDRRRDDMPAGRPDVVADEMARDLTPADQVARAALARAQQAARNRGLWPGATSRTAASAAGPSGTTSPDARDPQLVGVAAGRLAAERGWRPGLVEGDLRGRWP